MLSATNNGILQGMPPFRGNLFGLNKESAPTFEQQQQMAYPKRKGCLMIIDFTDVEVAFLKAAMEEAIVQAKAAPYAEAVSVMPIFQSIAKKLEG